MIKRLGGEVWRVKRGPEPSWYEHAITYNKGETNIGWAMSKHHLTTANVHASEYSWVGTDFDRIITNESTIEDLRGAIDIR
jgi:hypothetical protein